MRKLLTGWVAYFLIACLLTPLFGAPTVDFALGEGAGGVDPFAWLSGEIVRYGKIVTPKGTLNMRSRAKDDAKVLDRVPKGSIVRILSADGEWTQILYKGNAGYVKSGFLEEIAELPYPSLAKGDKGDSVLAFKRALAKLDYLASEDINTRFDAALETALIKIQLMNNVPLNPALVTPELQALIEWGMVVRGKSGYLDTAVDAASGLTVAIYCWDSAGTLYEKDRAVKVEVSYGVQATGGQPPYAVTVKKSLGGEASGDEVPNPFSHIWSQSVERLYVYATVVDSAGNTATACAPFRYRLPDRYQGD